MEEPVGRCCGGDGDETAGRGVWSVEHGGNRRRSRVPHALGGHVPEEVNVGVCGLPERPPAADHGRSRDGDVKSSPVRDRPADGLVESGSVAYVGDDCVHGLCVTRGHGRQVGTRRQAVSRARVQGHDVQSVGDELVDGGDHRRLGRGRDFRRDWSTAQDVGWKAAAQNLAAVAAMGATPSGLLVALVAPPGLPVAWATAMIDVSDGLVRDLGRLARASGVSVALEGAALGEAFGAALVEAAGAPGDRDPLDWVLAGGGPRPGGHFPGRRPAAGRVRRGRRRPARRTGRAAGAAGRPTGFGRQLGPLPSGAGTSVTWGRPVPAPRSTSSTPSWQSWQSWQLVRAWSGPPLARARV